MITGQQAIIGAIVLIVVILAACYGYKWYKTNYPSKTGFHGVCPCGCGAGHCTCARGCACRRSGLCPTL